MSNSDPSHHSSCSQHITEVGNEQWPFLHAELFQFSKQDLIAVGPVSIPAGVNRSQLTIQVATNRVAVDEFNCRAEPLNDNITSVIASDLAVLLGTSQVATVPLGNFDPAYRVTVDI